MKVGYGDINPVTAVEEIVCMALMMIGVIFFGFVISSSQCAHLHQHVAPSLAHCDCSGPMTALIVAQSNLYIPVHII